MSPRIRVLVVDDSAFARKVIRESLERDPEIEVVGIARDGLEALEKVAQLKPDLVTLDLVMPDLDGIGFLKALPKNSDVRVLIVSVSNSETDLALEALSLGAVDVVTKPTPLPTDLLYSMSAELVAKVKSLRGAKARVSPPPVATAETKTLTSNSSLLVIGVSTGGPQALTSLFEALPKNFPLSIAIALHIPEGYTGPLAARLTRLNRIPVSEATDGLEIPKGHAVLAPGGQHLRVIEKSGRYFASISREPYDTLFHPSVNVLFESAARAGREAAVGLVLTGMGDDGLLGARAIKAAGGRLVAEAESSCVVFGMPRVVIEAKLTDAVADLGQMASELMKLVSDDQ